MKTYIIKESCVLVRKYTIEANSKEEARLKHDRGLSTTDSYYDEDTDGSHQIEEIVEETLWTLTELLVEKLFTLSKK